MAIILFLRKVHFSLTANYIGYLTTWLSDEHDSAFSKLSFCHFFNHAFEVFALCCTFFWENSFFCILTHYSQPLSAACIMVAPNQYSFHAIVRMCGWKCLICFRMKSLNKNVTLISICVCFGYPTPQYGIFSRHNARITFLTTTPIFNHRVQPGGCMDDWFNKGSAF